MEVPPDGKHGAIPDPEIPLLGIYHKEVKAHVHMHTCRWMFTAALVKKIKKWIHPKCSSANEWINKMCYICAMEYYSATKGIKY